MISGRVATEPAEPAPRPTVPALSAAAIAAIELSASFFSLSLGSKPHQRGAVRAARKPRGRK